MVDESTLNAGIAILGITVPAIAGLLGIKWQQAKNVIKDVSHKANLVTMKAKQASLLLETISAALEDDKITANEAKIISKQIKTLVAGLKEDEIQ